MEFRGCELVGQVLDELGDLNGGRDRDRTCDPLHVKEVLFR